MATYATLHNTSYPRISPTHTLNTHADRTILILGSSEGIGFSIAKSFALASASRVILVSRSREHVSAARARLSALLPDHLRLLVIIDSRVCTMESKQEVQNLWASLERDNIQVDVLVICATPLSTQGSVLDLLQLGKSLDCNVLASIRMAKYFIQHIRYMSMVANGTSSSGPDATSVSASASMSPPTFVSTSHIDIRSPSSNPQHPLQQIHSYTQRTGSQTPESEWSNKAIINISSFVAHTNPVPGQGVYAACKAATASLFQHLAEEFDAAKLQIININPGVVLTERSIRGGMRPNSLPYVDVELPADFCAWAATSQARFLHGRFVWANWDVDELVERQHLIEGNAGLLKIGLQGIEEVDIRNLFHQLESNAPPRRLAEQY